MHLMYWVNGAGYIGDMFFGERHPQNQNPFVAHNKSILMLNTERPFFISTEAPTKSKPPMMELAELDEEEDETDEI